MIKRFKYFIVDASALPKIIIKVAFAANMIYYISKAAIGNWRGTFCQ